MIGGNPVTQTAGASLFEIIAPPQLGSQCYLLKRSWIKLVEGRTHDDVIVLSTTGLSHEVSQCKVDHGQLSMEDDRVYRDSPLAERQYESEPQLDLFSLVSRHDHLQTTTSLIMPVETLRRHQNIVLHSG